MIEAEVTVTGESQKEGFLGSILRYLLPFILLIGIWIFLMNRMQGGGGGAMSFGKSKARLLNQNEDRKTFDDVAGIDEAKEELQEIVDFLRDPNKFSRLGGQIPKGALLIGPPGTGKKPCWHGLSRAKQVCRFSPFQALTSWKCLSAWVPVASAICLNRPRKTRPASFLLMK